MVINLINSRSPLPAYNPDQPKDFLFADVSGDGVLSARDALLIINEINTRGSGEGELAGPPQPVAVDELFNEFSDLSQLVGDEFINKRQSKNWQWASDKKQ